MPAIHRALTHGEDWLSVRPGPGGRPLLRNSTHTCMMHTAETS
ncbi:hypothetical protein HMPREF0004_1051 [Achromobacter piechaudii ATCC 43553]|uniref:Uncharacterized protein n=1 Tax=Achromobacter piechaudii ATCC 43553 TaxID=742159 RepID=D4X6F4_9BURK|nr:hypothetical protein HMPREF0004_1051 [Achromobacter piechaudii ATCC 43553]